MKKLAALALSLTLLGGVAQAHDDFSNGDTNNGFGSLTNMAGMNHGGSGGAIEAMSGQQMQMGPHMKMTALRPPNYNDQQRADQIVQILRQSLQKYTDYHVALAEGFQPFSVNANAPITHFNNYGYARNAQGGFDPARPTSLLYRRVNGGYSLLGAMYTAPANTPEQELDQRVPLSVAQWHAHVNICLPPGGMRALSGGGGSGGFGGGRFGGRGGGDASSFGGRGSIATPDACEAAGGRFMPQVFGWMVHVYPWESTPSAIWANGA